MTQLDHDNYSDGLLREILTSVRTIAIVGASSNPARPSNGVLHFLAGCGYRVLAVNPGLAGTHIGAAPVYASLSDIPEQIDMVDVFRNSKDAGDVVTQALALANLPKVIWMQLGVFNLPAARQAEARGVIVIMNRCPKIEIDRLGL
jgi:predicted CoA-binding protein